MMLFNVVRLGDATTRGRAITGSNKVLVNGIPTHRLFDLTICRQGSNVSIRQCVKASENTFGPEPLGFARLGVDNDDCPANYIQGSGNVFTV